MSVALADILLKPDGSAASNAIVRITSLLHTLNGVGRNSLVEIACDANGSYSFTLQNGTHRIEYRYDDRYELQGTIVVSDTTVATTLAELLVTADEASDQLADLLQSLVDQAEAAVSAASTSATNAAASATAAELSNQQSATNAATTTSDKNIIAGYRTETLVAKTEAQRWATGISGSGVNTPSDSNNAFYYSEVARNNANQTFKSGGYFTPTAGQEYPNVTSVEVDTIWLIKFASETGLYTFTTGDLAGQTVKNGFMLVYDTPADTFDYIPTTLSGVTSVNGLVPNAVGNITIDAEAISAADSRSVQVHLDELGADVTSNTVTNVAITNNLLKFHPIY